MTVKTRRIEQVPTKEVILESIAQNNADRNDDLIDLIKLLDSIEGPYSLLLDAAWGDGKTFFVKSLVEVLRALNKNNNRDPETLSALKGVTDKLNDVKTPYLPFYFNAWENDFAEDPISALFANLAVTFNETGLTKEHPARKCIASIIDASLSVANLPPVASELTKMIAGESLIAAYEKHLQLRERIDELAEKSKLEIADKLVIIIDELDRCRPDFAVRLLEQTKALFQNENIIVIISADSLQLAHAIGGLYGPEFDSQHFVERFFDQRLTLPPVDVYKVATGKPLQDTMHNYDLMTQELLNTRNLTIRDYFRIHSKLEAGRVYCDVPDDGSLFSTVAKCLLVPTLIFIERDDTELFRSITHGIDYDALYEYGSRYTTFNNCLRQIVALAKTGQRWTEDSEISEEDCRQYVHDMCVWLYSSKRNSQELFEAHSRIGSPMGINRSVFTALRFPKEN